MFEVTCMICKKIIIRMPSEVDEFITSTCDDTDCAEEF